MTSHHINWKTISAALMGLLGRVASAPYELEYLGAVIPPKWKEPVSIAAYIAAFVLFCWKGSTDRADTIKAANAEKVNPEPQKQ